MGVLTDGLARLGLHCRRDGDRLLIEGDRSRMTDAVAAAIRERKTDILAELDEKVSVAGDETARIPQEAGVSSPLDEARALLALFNDLSPLELDRLIVLGLGYFDDADLGRLNVALARRAGLDPDDLCETSRAFDEPPLPPIE